MKSSFILHIDSLCILDKMTDEQAGKFIKAIYFYQKNKELPELDLLLEMAITPFINQFFRDEKGYEKTVEKNRENGKRGGRPKKEPKKPTGLNGNPNNPSEPKKADSDSDSENDSDSGNDSKKKSFVKPTKVEVKEYFISQGAADVEADGFYDHYESNGWKVSGKAKMQDWKAAVRNWVRNSRGRKNTPVVPLSHLSSTGTSGRVFNPNDPKHKW